MTPRDRLLLLIDSAAAMADDIGETPAAFVLGALAVALVERADREMANGVAWLAEQVERRPLTAAEICPKAGEG